MPRLRPDSADLRYARLWLGLASTATLAESMEVPELTLLLALGDPRRAVCGGRRWTRAEDAVLMREYPSGDTEVVARSLGRSPQAVKNRTNNLGLRKTRAWRTRWMSVVRESREARKFSRTPVRNAVSLPNE